MTRQIHVHIDRLVLEGVAPDELDPQSLSADVSTSLEQLLARDGLGERMAAGGSWSSGQSGDLDGAGRPRDLGPRIAGAIHDGLRGREGAGP